ncbi:MAG TPA: GNAT family N-acetyltransferase, partial [Candidatus Bathyarchaeia archaeon]|nr:GNAT family N-acetyltransferase [Candidatus Bathyarchaeia archaeon]
DLFAFLVKRHKITGIRAFSKSAFAKQLRIPGMVMFRASSGGETVGLDLWYVQGQVAYGHLVACSPLGYKLSASYALKWFLIQYFADKVNWIDMGGTTGIEPDTDDGLTKFKRGWATGTRPVYFCGRILNDQIYSELVKAMGTPTSDYFPAYRAREFS